MTEEKKNVHFMIKTHINRTRTVWKSENENDIAEWDKLQNWKIWVSNREEITTLITLIKTKKLNDLFHAEEKLTSLISRYVRCTDAAFEILILLEIININLKTFYSLDFNSNEESLQYPRRANVGHAWLTNNKISEYKQYRFESNLNEVRETIRINKSEAFIESIQAKTSITLTNSTLRQNASILLFSSSLQRSDTSQRSSIATPSQYEEIYSDTSQFSVLKMKSIKDKTSEIEKQSSSTMKTIEINMSSDEKEIEKYNETIEHKQTLTVAATFKIVQLTLIEKRLNHTTMKLFESWKKKIEFLKSLREDANKKTQNKITERMNELKHMMRKLAEERNKLRDDVVRIFPTTTQRIFAHNENNSTERIIRWSFTTESVAKILEVEDVYSTQLLRSLLSAQVQRSETTSTETNRALSFANERLFKTIRSQHWHEFEAVFHQTLSSFNSQAESSRIAYDRETNSERRDRM